MILYFVMNWFLEKTINHQFNVHDTSESCWKLILSQFLKIEWLTIVYGSQIFEFLLTAPNLFLPLMYHNELFELQKKYLDHLNYFDQFERFSFWCFCLLSSFFDSLSYTNQHRANFTKKHLTTILKQPQRDVIFFQHTVATTNFTNCSFKYSPGEIFFIFFNLLLRLRNYLWTWFWL